MKTLGIGAAAAILAMAGVACAQTMVVSAQGPSANSYAAGVMLKPGAVLDLKAGDHVTVFQNGGTRRFDGPGRFSPLQPSPEARTALALLISQKRPAGAARVGAVRGFGGSGAGSASAADGPAGLWQVDVAAPGTVCIAQGQSPQLWRSTGKAGKTMITRVSDDASTEVVWAADERVIDWPTGLPTADGESYLLSTPGGGDGGVTWRVVAAPSGDWTTFASALAKAGCTAQLDTLKASIAPVAAR